METSYGRRKIGGLGSGMVRGECKGCAGLEKAQGQQTNQNQEGGDVERIQSMGKSNHESKAVCRPPTKTPAQAKLGRGTLEMDRDALGWAIRLQGVRKIGRA